MSQTEPVFRAVGVVTVGDRQLASEPFVFDRSGATLILQREGEGFGVVQSHRVEPGIARFEKTVTQPVVFLVERDGQPYWKVEVKSLFDSMRLELRVG